MSVGKGLAAGANRGLLAEDRQLLSNTLPLIQRDFVIGAPDDPMEREADRLAYQVMNVPDGKPVRVPLSRASRHDQTQSLHRDSVETLHRQSTDEEEDAQINGKGIPGDAPKTTPILSANVNALRKDGQPLPQTVRKFFEPRFACDFSAVRIHRDARAAESARSVNARAYTIGRDIVFGAGQYSPETRAGRGLIAHELAHTIQHQGKGDVVRRALDCNTTPRQTDCSEVPPEVPGSSDRLNAAASAVDEAWQDVVNVHSKFQEAGQNLEEAGLAPTFEEVFGEPTPERTGNVSQNLDAIKSTFQDMDLPEVNPARSIPVLCGNECEPVCAGANAIYSPSEHSVVLCDGFFRGAPLAQEATIIHEAVHAALGDQDIDVYTDTRLFALLKGEPSSNGVGLPERNPDSFAVFVLAIAKGLSTAKVKSKGAPPGDKFVGFRKRPGEKQAVQRAIAFAENVIRVGESATHKLVSRLKSFPEGKTWEDEESAVGVAFDMKTLYLLRESEAPPPSLLPPSFRPDGPEPEKKCPPVGGLGFDLGCPIGEPNKADDLSKLEAIHAQLKNLESVFQDRKGLKIKRRRRGNAARFRRPFGFVKKRESIVLARDKIRVSDEFFDNLDPTDQVFAIVNAIVQSFPGLDGAEKYARFLEENAPRFQQKLPGLKN